jgi:DNA-binding SARP family transcriptional activator
VRLSLEAGAVVDADRLLDDLWAGAATRRNTLQSKVARLRRALGDPSVIVSRDGGYELAVEPDAVDALRVLRDAATASRQLETGDVPGAAEVSAVALERYRGEVLHSTGDWAAPHRARLEEVRVKLLETQLSARVQLGHGAIGELEAAVASHPYQEGLWEAADHRAVPGGPPGRRARHLPAGPHPGWPTSSASNPDRR